MATACWLTRASEPCPRNRSRKKATGTITACETVAVNAQARPKANATSIIILRGPTRSVALPTHTRGSDAAMVATVYDVLSTSGSMSNSWRHGRFNNDSSIVWPGAVNVSASVVTAATLYPGNQRMAPHCVAHSASSNALLEIGGAHV